MENVYFKDLTVVKRSGQRVLFNGPKIAVAIKAAFDDEQSDSYSEKDINKVYEDTLKYIKDNYQDRKTINVEDIQDIIEKVLLNDKYQKIYEHFSEYRIKRAESRKAFSEKQQHKFVKAIEKIGVINSLNDKPINVLSNFGETIVSEYNRAYILDNKYVRAHEEGKIYIHNLSYFSLGFLNDTHLIVDNYLIKEEDFLELSNFLNNVRQEICGEIALDDFDDTLYQFSINKFIIAFKDSLYNYLKVTGFLDFVNYKKYEDIINRLDTFDIDFNIFNQLNDNYFTRRILQTAYEDSITYISQVLKDSLNSLFMNLDNNNRNQKYSISFGKDKKNMFIQDILISEINKLPKLSNITFIYKFTKDSENVENITSLIINEKNIALECNEFDKNVNMFANGLKIYDSNNSIKTSKGRSSIALVSINLARLGLKYKNLNNDFYNELDELLELAKNELIFIFETIGDKYKENYQYLFNKNILDDEKLDIGQKIRKVIKNGTLNINMIGLKECSISISETNYKKIEIDLLNYINTRFKKIVKDLKYNFTISSINYENVSSFMIELDKTIFGIIPKMTKKECYDNLCEIKNINNLENELINIEDIQKHLNGGLILTIYISSNITTKKLKDIIEKLFDYKADLIKFKIVGDK